MALLAKLGAALYKGGKIWYIRKLERWEISHWRYGGMVWQFHNRLIIEGLLSLLTPDWIVKIESISFRIKLLTSLHLRLQPDQISWNSKHELKLSGWRGRDDLITLAAEQEYRIAVARMSEVKSVSKLEMFISAIMDQHLSTCPCFYNLNHKKFIMPPSLKP